MDMPRVLLICSLISIIGTVSCNLQNNAGNKSLSDNFMVRVAEIEIEDGYIEEYLSILSEEAEASVRLEKGVICIYPMYQAKNPSQIRLLEIYASQEAYEAHLQTPHFKHYKTSTQHMVKSLRLIDMESIDPGSMSQIFRKLGH